jgi:GNAT superfamily N-acetyltransferase
VITFDPARRDEAVEAGWRAYSERVPTLRGAYDAVCQRYRVIAICNDSEVIGALFELAGEIHVGVIPEWRGRWITRKVIKEALSYGKSTRVLDSEPECIDFVTRLGFEKQGDLYVSHR